jgi:hypothetical protein
MGKRQGGLAMKRYEIGQRVIVFWLTGSASTPEGEITKVRRSFVEVTFDREPGGGFDKVQKFTIRKNGEFVASGWHWVSGVPGLRAI